MTKIHKNKTPHRIHFINEWAEKRNLKQSDIVEELGADKSIISRWFHGSIPSEKYLESLASLMATDIGGLFRHPDDDWLAGFLRNRNARERERLLKILLENVSNPDNNDTGTDG